MSTISLPIELDPAYEVCIKSGLLKQASIIRDYCKPLASCWVIVADDQLVDTYADKLYQDLKKHNAHTYLLTIHATESTKTRSTKLELEDQLFQLGCDRDTCLIALGGGITTDVVGFTAATFNRGIPVIYIPTTLLAMVDASVGGKTGVNTDYGKNLIGQFYQPSAVVIDPDVLQTLPAPIFAEGMAEVIKHALLADSELWYQLRQHHRSTEQLAPDRVQHMIARSITIKKELVEQDEYEQRGPRQLLNLGHTVAHAIERVSHYTLRHGEAVALGLIVEAYIAVGSNIAPSHLPDKIKELLATYQLPTQLSTAYATDELIDAMRYDKKNQANAIHCCLLADIGQPYVVHNRYSHAIDPQIIRTSLQAIQPV